MPLAKQLRSFMERGDVQEIPTEQLACQREHLGDIKDGSGYRDLGAWGRNGDKSINSVENYRPGKMYRKVCRIV